MHEAVKDGTQNGLDGKPVIYYDGYWIRYYAPPANTLPKKKALIDQMTKRAFHHTEEGINTPGRKLNRARAAWESETDPARKRVNAAMLAGALFNRATDLFTTIVELGEMGVEISMDNELMKQCGECFKEALDLGKYVKHYSGEEGIDELWGEPFRAFSIPLEDFYESRYIKIGQTLRDIDKISRMMIDTFSGIPAFADIEGPVCDLATAAKIKTETLRTDRDIFDLWAGMVTAGERLASFHPILANPDNEHEQRVASFGTQLICNGRDLIFHVVRARVAMPKSTREFVERCDTYAATGIVTMMPIPLPG